jgi:hypothetical protein
MDEQEDGRVICALAFGMLLVAFYFVVRWSCGW